MFLMKELNLKTTNERGKILEKNNKNFIFKKAKKK